MAFYTLEKYNGIRRFFYGINNSPLQNANLEHKYVPACAQGQPTIETLEEGVKYVQSEQ